MKRCIISLLTFIFLAILLFTSCRSNRMTVNYGKPTESKTNTKESEQIRTEIGITPSLDLTPIYINSPQLPTYSPMPTYTTDNIKIIINDLLFTNGGCELPCWWGINFGETNWIETTQKFDSFMIKHYESVGYLKIQGEIVPQVIKEYSYIQGGNYINILLYNLNDIVLYSDIITNFVDIYNIVSIKKSLGIPDQVLIKAYPEEEGYPVYIKSFPFDLALIYEDENIVVLYNLQATVEDNNIKSCFVNDYQIHLWIWSDLHGELPVKHDALNVAGGGQEGSMTLLSIDEVTNKSITTFMELVEENQDICIEIPLELYKAAGRK